MTADVQAWVDGTANDGWRISDSVEDFSNLRSKFYTREKGDSTVPKLDVTYVTAPILDAGGPSSATGSGSTLSWSHTVGAAGADRIIIVGISVKEASITGVT